MPAAKESASASASAPVDIIDIRANKVDFNLKDELSKLIDPRDGSSQRQLPTMLLYDERGLQLFEDITYLDEYYLTEYEIELLRQHAADIAKKVPDGTMLLELGSGNLRKVCLLLQAFEDAGKSVDYYALDLSLTELERTLANVPSFRYVSCHGLLGTYDDGRAWLAAEASTVQQRPKCIIHLGSSIGNFSRDEGAEFLRGFADIMNPQDSFVIGLDSCGDPDKIYHAYNDKKGVTHQFILNGLINANHLYGKDIFNVQDWRVIGEYVYDNEGGRHQAFLSPLKEVTVLGTVIKAHERVKIEQSLKYSATGSSNLFRNSGLREVSTWTRGDEYGLHLLKRFSLPFSKAPSVYATAPLPTMLDWEGLWTAWDIVTKGMLPPHDLSEKPIKLRNACIFYLGHIPTFLDIQLTKTTGLSPTDPASYYAIFERGIDPDVDNPEHCHDHSEVPSEWPPVEAITAYQYRVRARLRGLYGDDAGASIPRDVARGIWVAFEHELMHIETLLYMMLQSDKTLPPPHISAPDFEQLAEKAAAERVDNRWFDIPEKELAIGMDDDENDLNSNSYFGWDNEKPRRQVRVHAFQAKGRAITNEEYASYMFATNLEKLPQSWSLTERTQPNGAVTNGTSVRDGSLPMSFIYDKAVRTVYGLVPLALALDWPVFASYDELAGCAAWLGGRIPTLEEARSIYEHVEDAKELSMGTTLTKKVPAVNGHLVNDGVEETPPSHTLQKVGDSGTPELFIDLAGRNVGFSHWHPQPVTGRGGQLAGQAGLGGVWEWTSSALEKHDGFKPMALYPQYTTDFFDGKHNVVLGGSWATHPRIAGRKSFVNWYQRNYPYAWVGARLVRDV